MKSKPALFTEAGGIKYFLVTDKRISEGIMDARSDYREAEKRFFNGVILIPLSTQE